VLRDHPVEFGPTFGLNNFATDATARAAAKAAAPAAAAAGLGQALEAGLGGEGHADAAAAQQEADLL